MSKADDRFSRQESILPTALLQRGGATVIGTGAIGRQVALQLAACGMQHIELVDFDTVDVVNLGPQGFYEGQVGKKKVDAVIDVCRAINPSIRVEAFPCRFAPGMEILKYVFCCVDSIKTRDQIARDVIDRCELFIDGRMLGEVIQVYTAVPTKESKAAYLATIFNESEAEAGSCTAKTSIFTASIAAGLMLSQLSKFMRKFPLDVQLHMNLLSSEMSSKTVEVA